MGHGLVGERKTGKGEETHIRTHQIVVPKLTPRERREPPCHARATRPPGQQQVSPRRAPQSHSLPSPSRDAHCSLGLSGPPISLRYNDHSLVYNPNSTLLSGHSPLLPCAPPRAPRASGPGAARPSAAAPCRWEGSLTWVRTWNSVAGALTGPTPPQFIVSGGIEIVSFRVEK